MAWWIWAIGLAAAASRTTNPLLLALMLGVLGIVVVNRRSEAPWARAFKYYLVMALVVVGIRVAFRSIFGGDIDPRDMHVIFTLPRVPLPSWAAGVQLGGAVTVEGTLSALYSGLQLAVLLCCLGAANVLANPKRALRVLPGALYELGVAVVVALSVAPQLVESFQRVRRARKLRGAGGRGIRSLRGIAMPVLEGALERALQLAAAMDSRGYGRTGGASPGARRLTGLCMVGGMCGLCVGAYGLLDGSAPEPLGIPALAVGGLLCVAGLAVGGRRVQRTHYRPDPWHLPEWVVATSGLVTAVVLWSGAGSGLAGLNPTTDPLSWPRLPLVPALGILVAVIAAIAAPPPRHPLKDARDTASAHPRDIASAHARSSATADPRETGDISAGQVTTVRAPRESEVPA
ncbi:MAG: energy-coupling factor transporter transmembrane component T [Actinomycetota bacterium]|jgi:energy-coupling factor transport system permease protein|nr:energy-coupling factor transporter transmembrane component T [Actinomycetota bacterium]